MSTESSRIVVEKSTEVSVTSSVVEELKAGGASKNEPIGKRTRSRASAESGKIGYYIIYRCLEQ
jgi:hypothetical protein